MDQVKHVGRFLSFINADIRCKYNKTLVVEARRCHKFLDAVFSSFMQSSVDLSSHQSSVPSHQLSVHHDATVCSMSQVFDQNIDKGFISDLSGDRTPMYVFYFPD